MSSLVMLARKEVREILRTSRIVVLPAIFLFFALSGPVMARFTPEILTAVAGDQLGALQLPPATVFDAYAQWVKNISQIGLFAMIIAYGGIISSERRRGTAVLVLTKPVSRAGFVLAKFLVQALYVSMLLLVMSAVTWGTTAVVFGEAPAGALWGGSAAMLLMMLVYLALVTLFSVLVPSAAGAAGLGIGAFAVLSIASIWAPLADHSPAGLGGTAARLASGSSVDALGWQIGVSLLLIAAAVGAAMLLFRRQEL